MRHRYAGSVIFTITENENGETEVGEPCTNFGYLIDIEIVEKIIESCKRNKKKFPTNEIRDAFNAKWQMEDEEEYRRESAQRKEAAKIEAANKKPKGCHIYLIQDTIRGFYKIGQSKDYLTRFKTLKSANPCIEIVLAYSGIFEDEGFFHKHFSQRGKHIGGEWFKLDESDIEEILSILQKYNRPILYNKLAA